MQRIVAAGFRWTGRIVSLSFLAFFLFMLAAHLAPGAERPFGPLSFHDQLSFACIAMMFLGYLLAWKGPTLGSVVSLVAIVAVGFMTNLPVSMLALLCVPGLAYVLSALALRSTARKEVVFK